MKLSMAVVLMLFSGMGGLGLGYYLFRVRRMFAQPQQGQMNPHMQKVIDDLMGNNKIGAGHATPTNPGGGK